VLSKINTQTSWKESLAAITERKVLIMLLLGFSAGLPLLLIFSSLSLWLREAGVSKSAVTYFSWAALGYSFKFVWAPLIDRLPLPFLTRTLGPRRSWLLVAQGGVIASICLMACIDPAQSESNLQWIALGAVLLGFSSATQDIVIDAYRIEAADTNLQAMMSASYIAGYRLGMISAGAGALFIAGYLGTTLENYSYHAWKVTYLIMASFMLIGVMTTLLIREPEVSATKSDPFSARDHLRLVFTFAVTAFAFIACYYYSAELSQTLKSTLTDIFNNKSLASFLVELLRLLSALALSVATAKLIMTLGFVNPRLIDVSYKDPVSSFFNRYGNKTAWLILALIGLYRISDIVLGVVSNLFYQDMGFSKEEIATAVKLFGLIMSILGGFCGGLLAMRTGVITMLFCGAILSSLTNLLFMLLNNEGHDLQLLYTVVAADNFVAGLAGAAFIAFLSSLVDVRFTAMQYAIFSSLMTLIPKVLGGYSGSLVEQFGYGNFFILTALIGIPVLGLIYAANKHLQAPNAQADSKEPQES